MKRLNLFLTLALIAPSAALAQAAGPTTPAPESPPAVKAPPAKAIKSGTVVEDRTGLAIGQVKTLTESPRGAMVVVEIDGKLVSVPQSTLHLEGERAVSHQTKAQMLAAAGAPTG